MLEEAVLGMQFQLKRLLTSTAASQDAESGTISSYPNATETPESVAANPQNASGSNFSDPDPENQSLGDPISRGMVSLDEANSLIQLYQARYIMAFPFVPLRAKESAVYLQQHYPFLLLCILAITVNGDHPHRQALAAEVNRQIFNQFMLAPKRNIDFLCGLLIQTAWHHHLTQDGHVQILLYIQLCVTACYDLDLESKSDMTDREARVLLGTYWLSAG